MIEKQQIYEKSNQGLDIILHYYPQAQTCLEGTKKFFKIREESTASSSIKKVGEVWRVTDFGESDRSMSPIDVAMKEEGCNFSETMHILAQRYGVSGSSINRDNRPVIRKRAADKDETGEAFTWEEKEPSEKELKVLGPLVTANQMNKYGYKALKSYTRTKDGFTTTIESTDNYPIFMRVCKTSSGEFYKIYQPLNQDKGYRFFYVGEKPRDYINGLHELQLAYAEYKKNMSEGDPEKLPEAVICSGERDALNVLSLGYLPLWFNSETYELKWSEYNTIANYVMKIYNIPDLDETGVRKGVELGMKYREIYTVWLPERIRNFRDERGKPKKDFRDYMTLYPEKSGFESLLRVSMPFRFWEHIRTKQGVKIEINTIYLLNFLYYSGFSTVQDPKDPDGYSFVREVKGVVTPVLPIDIVRFIREYAEKERLSLDIQNLILNSGRVSPAVLKNLKPREFDFTAHGPDFQYLFFENETWRIEKSGVSVSRGLPPGVYVREEKVIQKKVKRVDPAFRITKNEAGEWDIDILNKESKYFCYLINTSRIYWQKELETEAGKLQDPERYRRENKFEIAGSLLSDAEISEQKLHLINKIFAIGYLMHRHKWAYSAWCVLALDDKMDINKKANGGTGKSFFFEALEDVLKISRIDGKRTNPTESKHMYERVTDGTDYVFFDDVEKGFSLKPLFNDITAGLIVNVKNIQSYELSYEKSPKITVASNYVLTDIEPSDERRLLFTSFSDYYHSATEDNGFKESRTIFDDFGMQLFKGLYPDEERNIDYNFWADCLAFFLSVSESGVKINPPRGNIRQRTLNASISESFRDWADVFFSPRSENLDSFLIRNSVFADFIAYSGLKTCSAAYFAKQLKAYVQLSKVIEALNPPHIDGVREDGRIIRRVDGKVYECFYLKTYDKTENKEDTQENTQADLFIQTEKPL